ncbi:MAG TPA: hypothetical protein VK470_17850 [Bacteroidota bacterium]|nr:hypothetical protein [Bacteroidota bacterium]
MNLTIGLFRHDVCWEQLLTQIGVSWSVVGEPSTFIPGSYSAMIVNAEPDASSIEQLRVYMRDGGALLGDFGRLRSVLGLQTSHSRYSYISPQRFGKFSPSSLLDIDSTGRLLTGSSHLAASGQMTAFGPETQGAFPDPDVIQIFSAGNGIAISLPFDCSALFRSSEFRRKNFYAPTDRLPSEYVSTVSKGPLREIVTNVLEYLHHARRLPFVHTWYYPDGKPSVFTFRVDTDQGNQTELAELHELCTRHGVKGTWFADVKSHESWLDFFSTFRTQEIGLHCYEHRTDEAVADVRANFSKGVELLRRAGFDIHGASAPTGKWNMAVDTVYRELGIAYSSEFCLSYDDLPFYPVVGPVTGHLNGPVTGQTMAEDLSPVMQLPIHPVCVGSMRRSAFTSEQMRAYFRTWIDNRLRSREPVCLYHHPTHHHWEVFDDVFSTIAQSGIPSMTYGEYASWWKTRSASMLRCTFENGMLRPVGVVTESSSSQKTSDATNAAVHATNAGTAVYAGIGTSSIADTRVQHRISFAGGEEIILPIAGEIDTNTVRRSRTPERVVLPSDIGRARTFDPRHAVFNILDHWYKLRS